MNSNNITACNGSCPSKNLSCVERVEDGVLSIQNIAPGTVSVKNIMDSENLAACTNGTRNLRVEDGAQKITPGAVSLAKERRTSLFEVVCLGMVIAAVGVLLILPIIFYHLPMDMEKVSPKQFSLS